MSEILTYPRTSGGVVTFSGEGVAKESKAYTVGSYLAERLSQIGLKHHFAVAGDYNLVLLDQLLSNKALGQVYCSNELNCGFSAEGYARAHGAAAAVVTFSVGALSAFNAIDGAYAENLPVILISGAPNSNDRASEHLLHHTLGTHDFSYQLEMAKKITCAAVSITSAADAPALIDHAIRTALREKKAAYIEIACNISGASCAAPGPISAVTPEAMALAQAVLVTPIIAALTRQTVEDVWSEYRDELTAMRVAPMRRVATLIWDARFSLTTALLAGFGRAAAEVGTVIIVGGNIEGFTRVMTTTIALETSKGDLPLALGLGVVLIALIIVVNALAWGVRRFGELRTG